MALRKKASIDSRFDRTEALFKGVDARFDRVDANLEIVLSELHKLRRLVQERNKLNDLVCCTYKRLSVRMDKRDLEIAEIKRNLGSI